MPYVFRVTYTVLFENKSDATIVRLASESIDRRETGGILLGSGPDEDGVIRVAHAGDAGPKADRRTDFFNRDLEHTRRFAAATFREDRSTWVGEWHTHPAGRPQPSAIDQATYRQILDATPALAVFVSVIVSPDPAYPATDARSWFRPIIATWLIERVNHGSA